MSATVLTQLDLIDAYQRKTLFAAFPGTGTPEDIAEAESDLERSTRVLLADYGLNAEYRVYALTEDNPSPVDTWEAYHVAQALREVARTTRYLVSEANPIFGHPDALAEVVEMRDAALATARERGADEYEILRAQQVEGLHNGEIR